MILLPIPRKQFDLDQGYRLTQGKLIHLQGWQATELRFSAMQLQDALRTDQALDWELAAGCSLPDEQVGASLAVDPQAVQQAQGYELLIDSGGIQLTGHDPAGVFYGVCTLRQIIAQSGFDLPGLKIVDWPDFPARGVMLDISRNKVPKMETLFRLVDRLSSWKYNQLQLYMEHSFAYRQHPEVWAQASPMTGAEILELDAYCRARCVELVPNQNSFGHMERWLKHARYAHLAETHEIFQAPWGPMQGPFSLTPADPGSIDLVSSLYDELLPHFTSRMLNAGCDEAVDLGQGRSRKLCEERGSGVVYLDYLMEIYRQACQRGFVLQYWGDIIIHYPELMERLPKDALALEWGYEANHPFGPHCQIFAQAGIPFYVCPGTSSWNSLAGRTHNALENLQIAAENGLAYGASGYLVTDWGDNGHWQPLPVSYLGLAAGAAYGWCYFANREIDLAPALSLHAFDDQSGATGQAAYELGEVYRAVGVPIHNSSALFWALQMPLADLERALGEAQVDRHALINALQAIENAARPLETAQPGSDDRELVLREYRLVVDLLRHAARRALLLLDRPANTPQETKQRAAGLKAELANLSLEFESTWLSRNRPGGLQDSLAIFQRILAEYERA